MARYFVPFAAAILSLSLPLHAEDAPPRIVHAEIAALDQMLVYNRFGSFNPFGMIFALTRDLSPADAPPAFTTVAEQTEICAARTGAEPGLELGDSPAGNVRLKDCKRPRPLVLRANVGDILHVRLHNYLWGDPLPKAAAPDLSEGFCKTGGRLDANTTAIRALVAEAPSTAAEDLGLAMCNINTATQAAETKRKMDR